MYLSFQEEQRIFHLKDLFNKDLEFIWLLPSDEQLKSLLKLPFDCAKTIRGTSEKIDLVDSAKFTDKETISEVLICFCKENKMKVKQFMGMMRICLGGAKVGNFLICLLVCYQFLKANLCFLI